MADLTPAEELRAAAARLRAHAQAATPGPWYTGDCDLYPRWMLTMGKTDARGYVADVAKSYASDDFEVSDADWAWMALVHPGLAGPLAAWLEATAAWYEDTTLRERGRVWHQCGGEVGDGCGCFVLGLAVASAILGGGRD